MKTLALLLFLAGGSAAFADSDLLQNGDFSDGISHWDGDCHTPGSATDDSGATSGIVVTLRSGDWTKISQNFDGKIGNYLLTITYTVSPGLTLSQRAEDYTNVAAGMSLGGLPPFKSTPGDWCLVVVDSGINRFRYWNIAPTLTSGVKKITAKVILGSGENAKKGFFLGFPPGSGSINLQSVTLTPFDASAPST